MTDNLTTELSRQLHAQADDWQGAPLTLDSVRGRARSIQRTRRIVTGTAAAAVVAAVIVPTVMLLGTDLDADRDIPPTGPSPSRVIESPAPTPRADGTFPLTLDVAEGEIPRDGYIAVDDRQLVTPDGTFDLPGAFVQVLPYTDGWIGLRDPDGNQPGLEIVELDADLQELSAAPAPAFSGIVTTPDGSRLAWVETTGNGDDWTIVNAPADGGEPVRTPVVDETMVEGFLSDDRVAFNTTDQTTGLASFGETSAQGAFDSRALEGFQSVGGTSAVAGLVAGQTEFNGDSTCSQVRDNESGEVVMETCDYQLGAFSPDGRWIIGYATYFDVGSPTLAILDAATALPVVEWTAGTTPARAAVVLNAAWDDDDTLVASIGQVEDQAVLTLEANGAVTRSSGVLRQEMSIEFFPNRAIFAD